MSRLFSLADSLSRTSPLDSLFSHFDYNSLSDLGEIWESDDSFRMVLPVPGFSSETLTVTVSEGNLVRVEGEIKVEPSKDSKYRQILYSMDPIPTKLSHTFSLPSSSSVDMELVSAETRNGVLTITARKRTASTSTRTVKVKSV